jgi:formylglycine-generating enzyme required for sulfatase activity
MGNHLSGFKGNKLPVERVSWDSVQTFIKMLNQQSGQRYRLPSEAEWEYAARAGSQTKYPWGNQIDCSDASHDGGKGSVCYYKPEGRYNGPYPVGSYQSNKFGLYDTVGNVWEWVQDWYDESYYDSSPKKDPPGPVRGFYRGLRGGSWSSFASSSRSTYRYSYSPDSSDFTLGFRLARTR